MRCGVVMDHDPSDLLTILFDSYTFLAQNLYRIKTQLLNYVN